MKILLISVLPPEKVAEADHAYHIATHLAAHGVEVHVLAQEGAVLPNQPRLHVHPIMRRWSWSELPRLVKCLRQCRPDAVLLNYIGLIYNRNTMMTFIPTVARAVSPGTPFITQMEQVLGATSIGWRARLFNKALRVVLGRHADPQFGTLLRDSARVVVLSKTHLTKLKPAFPDIEAKSLLIPPAVIMTMSPDDTATRQQMRERLGVGPDDFLIAYLGYIYKNKGIETLLPAFERVCRRKPNVRLVLAGGTLQPSAEFAPGYAEMVHQLTDELGLRDKVTFTGGFDWDSDTASRYLRAADVAVLPFDEGIRMNNSSFAGVVAHGLPVITTEAKDLEAPFVHRDNVFLCRPRDPDHLAAAIETVLEDSALRETLRAGAARLAREWFSWDGATERLLSAFKEAGLQRKPGREQLETAQVGVGHD